MTEKTSLEKRLTDYLSDEPVMRLSLEEVVRRGRRQQRRRGWTAAFGVVVACSLVAVGAGWFADWGSDEGGTFAPAGQTRESGGPAPTPSTGADTVTGPAKMLRAVVIDYYGDGSEEVRLWGATWADFSVPHDLDDPLEHQPAVPAGEESTASEWHYRFRPNASTLVQLDAGLPASGPARGLHRADLSAGRGSVRRLYRRGLSGRDEVEADNSGPWRRSREWPDVVPHSHHGPRRVHGAAGRDA